MIPHKVNSYGKIVPTDSHPGIPRGQHFNDFPEDHVRPRHVYPSAHNHPVPVPLMPHQQPVADIITISRSRSPSPRPRVHMEPEVPKPEFHTSLTISADRSGNEWQGPNLLALREHNAPNQSAMDSEVPIIQPIDYGRGPPNPQQQQYPYWHQQQAHQQAHQQAMQQQAMQQQAMQQQAMQQGMPAPPVQMQYTAPQAAPGPGLAGGGLMHNPSSHQLQDYQMQLMLLEQQNKKRVLMARSQQKAMSYGLPPKVSTPDAYSETSASQHRPDIHREVTGPASTGSPLIKPSNWPETSTNEDKPPLTHLESDADDDKSVQRSLEKLSNGNPSNPDIQRLQEFIQQLQGRVQQLQTSTKDQAPSRYQLLYRIVDRKSHPGYKGVYFDHPRWIQGDMDQSSMQSDLHVDNLDLYLERNKDISFIVFQDFDPDPGNNKSMPQMNNPGNAQDVLAPPQHIAEFVRPVAKSLAQALETIIGSSDLGDNAQQFFQNQPEFRAPFTFIYHKRDVLNEIHVNMSEACRNQLALFLVYLDVHYGMCYATVDALLSRNRISPEYIEFLFKPEEVLISRTDGDFIGCVLDFWPSYHALSEKVEESSHNVQSGEFALFHLWRLSAWRWEFDGSFIRKYENLNLKLPANGMDEIAIADLDVYPLRFAPQSIVTQLQERGQTFWKCRKRRFVSYTEHDKAIERYMVDVETYKKLHGKGNSRRRIDDITAEALERDEPPEQRFGYLVPAKIKGYNLRRKQWVDLSVDRISDVVWNREAFQTLVIEEKTKDLIHALVSKQLAAERSTDLIAGKGNGLIMLLHGGPGTGKTLTAESVAEIAGKPLYRVTCGDVGTKAEDVEKYLESVLSLGKTWDCVVLLDEADVFLEQRSLRDLTRNALVSVFLRVLEYYDGILILTSNRVGTFDEAFKSRIQLALHYPALGPYQRRCIWENFINRLQSFGAVDDAPHTDFDTKGNASINGRPPSPGAVHIDDLRAHLDELAEERMNGRQIRNAITTARQYAEWKGGVLTYPLLKDVIEIAGRFDRYLDRLNGMGGDEIAAEEGLRVVEMEEDKA